MSIQIKTYYEFLTETTTTTQYTAQTYQYLYGSCGYYYLLKLQATGEDAFKLLVTEGVIHDKLEDIRSGASSSTQFLVKRISGANETCIGVDSLNDEITLS